MRLMAGYVRKRQGEKKVNSIIEDIGEEYHTYTSGTP